MNETMQESEHIKSLVESIASRMTCESNVKDANFGSVANESDDRFFEHGCGVVRHNGKWWLCRADEYGEVLFNQETGPYETQEAAEKEAKRLSGEGPVEVVGEVPKSWISKRVPYYLGKRAR